MDRSVVNGFASYRVILQPGDGTKYDLMYTHIRFDEVGISLLDMKGHGAAFCYSESVLRNAWESIREMPQPQQIDHHVVADINSHLGLCENRWTARAIIEGFYRSEEARK